MSLNGFSPAEFRELVTSISNIAEVYLEQMDSLPVQPDVSGEEISHKLQTQLPDRGLGMEALRTLGQVVSASRVQNGRFFGYVLGSGEPVAAAADLLASILNQNVTAWRSGPAAVTIERTVVGWLASAIGCPGFQGSLTGGGSSANLMGLAIARESRTPANESGVAGKGVMYASAEVHMSIPKSVALLGMGRENLRLVPCDSNLRMKVGDLAEMMDRDRAEGKMAVAVVASAGTVNTGSIDPLTEISAVAKKFGAWLHVDGAYGALAAIAVPEKFEALRLADSISLDAHKWLYQPLDCGCLLFRDPVAAQAAFAHTGDYARALTADPVEGFAFFEESLELSRRFRALKVR